MTKTANPTPTLQSTLKKLLRQRWKELAQQIKQLSADDNAEAIHELRINTRRLQELVPLAADVVKSPAAANTVKALRQARKVCSEVRDADVLMSMIEPRKSRAERDGRMWDAMTTHLRRRRVKSHSGAKRSLDRLDLATLSTKWIAALEKWPKADAKIEKRLRRDLVKHLSRRLKQFQRAHEAATKPEAMTEDVHNLRLAGKRLRFALEVTRDLTDGQAKSALGQLRTFQTALGEWSDLELLCELIIDRCSRRKFLREKTDIAQGLLQTLGKLRGTTRTKLRRSMSLADDLGHVNTVLEEFANGHGGNGHKPKAEAKGKAKAKT
jgi:CHAD domain-containing protein